MCGSTFDFDASSNACGFLVLGTIIFEIGYFFFKANLLISHKQAKKEMIGMRCGTTGERSA